MQSLVIEKVRHFWSNSFSRKQQQRKPILDLQESVYKCISPCLRIVWFARKLSHPNTWKSKLFRVTSNTCCDTFSRETFSNRCFFSDFRLMKASILFHNANFTGDRNISSTVDDGESVSLRFFLHTEIAAMLICTIILKESLLLNSHLLKITS